MSEGGYAQNRIDSSRSLGVGSSYRSIDDSKKEAERTQTIIETVEARRVRIENLLREAEANLEIAVDDEKFFRGIRFACDRDDPKLHRKLQENMESAQKRLNEARAERDRIFELLDAS